MCHTSCMPSTTACLLHSAAHSFRLCAFLLQPLGLQHGGVHSMASTFFACLTLPHLVGASLMALAWVVRTLPSYPTYPPRSAALVLSLSGHKVRHLLPLNAVERWGL